jgi:serine/threonine-protein kinase RsbT
MPPIERRIDIRRDADIITARQEGRELSQAIGFSGSDPTLVATAISEVARNILRYAGCGEIIIGITEQTSRKGILIIAQDHGPGIPNVEMAMRDGFSTGKSLGLGLPGSRRMMDEFEIVSTVGEGTLVTMRKRVR